MDLVAVYDKLSGPLRRRVRLMLSRAVLSLINDGGGLQLVQVTLLEGEVRDGVERVQNYGFTSVPHPGAEGVMGCISGDRDHGVIVAMDDRRFRLKGLSNGDVAVYDDQGQVLHFGRDKTVHLYGCDTLVADVGVMSTVTCPLQRLIATTKVEMTTPLLQVSGGISAGTYITAGTNVTAYGQVYDANGAKSMSGMRYAYNSHVHHEYDVGSYTGNPNQVM